MVILCWAPGHVKISRNEHANGLLRRTLMGSEIFCGVGVRRDKEKQRLFSKQIGNNKIIKAGDCKIDEDLI